MSDHNDAPPGTVWVCPACGKRSAHRIDGPGGWDTACYLKAVLCEEATIKEASYDGRVCAATAVNRDGWVGGRWVGPG